MDSESSTLESAEFGHFKVNVSRRELLLNGQPVQLGERAFDVLVCLVSARGRLVSKSELMKRVWSTQIVSENSLHAQIVAIRRGLGGDRELVRTVSGRGYQLVADVRNHAEARRTPAAGVYLPQAVSELFGREAELESVLGLLGSRRLVTLCGPGGIGKTRVAIEAARQFIGKRPADVRIAKLAPLSDPDLLSASVANAIGLSLAGGPASPDRIAAAIGSQRLLLVLDSCEHLIAAAAKLAEGLLAGSNTVHILATSREPLRVDGEQVYRIPPLGLPVSDDVADLSASAAVRLFLARAHESEPQFVADDGVIRQVAAICKRLDGIPLAIELAATQAATLGIATLAVRLFERLRVSSGSRRTALPRHQTLKATFDWSFDLLSDHEQTLLRRLSVFPAAFGFRGLCETVVDEDLTEDVVLDCLASLVSKSLVCRGDAVDPYILLESTRAYAHEKLAASAEPSECSRRHTMYCHRMLREAALDWEHCTFIYKSRLDDVRVALEWAYSEAGDRELAIAMTIEAIPLWFHLSLIDECRARVEAALTAMAQSNDKSEVRLMQLHAAHGWSLMYTTGPARETGAAWATALRLADKLNATDYQLRALWGLWAGSMNNGRFPTSLELAERFSSHACSSKDAADVLVGERMKAQSLHFLGRQAEALALIEHMLQHYQSPPDRSHIVRFQFDQRVTARITLARVQWLGGLPDSALATVKLGIEEAQLLDHNLSLGNFLAQAACPVALLVGDTEAVRRYLEMFQREAARNAREIWQVYGKCFQGALLIQEGAIASGVELLNEGVLQLRQEKFTQYQTSFLMALAEGLTLCDRLTEACSAIDDALRQCEESGEAWALAELLRLRAETLLRSNPHEAEDQFLQSIRIARSQGALAWELRTATSLARRLRDEGRRGEARALLAPVRGRFSEGGDTADIRSATLLLENLSRLNPGEL